MKNGIILSAIVFTLSLTACSNYLEEFEDEYRDSAYAKTDIFSPTESSASIIDAGDSSGTSSKDASSSDARAEGQSSGKTDEEYDCYMNDSACISKIANDFGKTVRLFDSRNNNVYTAIYVGGLYFETAGGESVFDDSVSFLLMTENLEYEGDSVTALDTNGVFFYTYENAEKACPTGWRLPKITPEWSFLLKGEGSQFYIELPDNENGCYTNGEFDSGKSIFYWAQKEGETSWFVQKNYLANDNSELPKKCNAFPVRCAKEFGRYADYAGSSSSSGETKSSFGGGNTSLSVLNCDDFGGDTLYDSDNVGGHVLWNIDLYNYGYNDNFVSNIVFDDKVEFCVEYKDVKKDSIPMAYLGNANYGYFYKYLSKDASAATFTINSNSDSCTTAISSTSKACESSNRQNVMENFKNFVIQNATATKIMVKGEYTIEYLSSSSSSVKSQSSSSSNISSSSGLQNCEAFKKDGDAYDLYGSEESLFVGTSINGRYEPKGNAMHLELKENSEFCIEFVGSIDTDSIFIGYRVDDNSAIYFGKLLGKGPVAQFTLESVKYKIRNGEGEKDGFSEKEVALANINYFYVQFNLVEIKSIYVKNAEIKENSSSSSVKSSSSSAKSSSSCEDIFNFSCLMSDAAKILNKNSSSSISGTLLFDASSKERKMKNGDSLIINSVNDDLSGFSEGWMRVYGNGELTIKFFTDPKFVNNQYSHQDVDISGWGGICMTYASNVSFDMNLHSKESAQVSFTFEKDLKFKTFCGSWSDWENLDKLKNIKYISLKPKSTVTPAVIYIKNIYTKKKTDVAFGLEFGNVEAQSDVCPKCFIWNVKETINLNLFDSYTVTGDDCSNFDLAVINNEDSYLLGVEKTNENVDVQIDDLNVCETEDGINPKTDLQCATTYGSLENPVLTKINGMACEANELTVTFHPKSWYAAPISN